MFCCCADLGIGRRGLLLLLGALVLLLLLLLSRGRTIRGRCWFCNCSGVGGTTGSALVDSNLPNNSVGNSTFSEGRSSMGIKSSSPPSVSILLSSSITAGALGLIMGFTTVSVTFSSIGFSSAGISIISVVVALTGCSSLFLFSRTFLRGRPTFFFGADGAFASGSGVSVFFSGSASFCMVSGEAGAAWATGLGDSVSAFVNSPFCLAENTLSSFFAGTRERFFLSSLRSSFSLSAATFFVAPAMACSSRIL